METRIGNKNSHMIVFVLGLGKVYAEYDDYSSI